jgi:hypothetical protein
MSVRDTVRRSAAPIMRDLSLLRVQLVVGVLAFVALSSVGTLHHVYRNLILDHQQGSAGFIVAVFSVGGLSLSIWFSSIVTLLPVPLPEWRSSRGISELREYLSRVPSGRSGASVSISRSTAAVIASISILPLVGLALGLWLAIPATPGRDTFPFPVQEERIPDQPTLPRRTELPLVSRG